MQLAEAIHGVICEGQEYVKADHDGVYPEIVECSYVRVKDNDGDYASVVRLWETTLTDGSKVYEVRIV